MENCGRFVKSVYHKPFKTVKCPLKQISERFPFNAFAPHFELRERRNVRDVYIVVAETCPLPTPSPPPPLIYLKPLQTFTTLRCLNFINVQSN